MALPAGITPKTVSVSAGSYADGVAADGWVTLIMPVNVVHLPTGQPIYSGDRQKRFVDGEVTFTLAPTDAAGLNRTDWTYGLRVEIAGATVQPPTFWFPLPQAGPDNLDIDKLTTVPSSAGTPVQALVVTSVNGQIGDVTVAAGVGSVNGKTGAVVLAASDIGAQPTGDYATNAAVTTASTADRARANHTGTQSADTLTDGTTNKAFLATERTKLTGVATGATANATDAQLRDRSTHTGTQAATTITGLATVATSGSYADLSAKPTIPTQYTDAQAVTANAAAVAVKAPLLAPTATKTAAYTVAVGELAVMNVAGGATALTLPTAPADKTQVGYRAVGATTAVPLVVTAGGTDTIGTTGATSASIPLADEVAVFQYQAAGTRWLAVSNVKTQASLDARYDASGAASTAQAAAVQRANHTGTQAATTITGLATVATTGSYTDLGNKPTIPAAYTDAQAVAAVAAVVAPNASLYSNNTTGADISTTVPSFTDVVVPLVTQFNTGMDVSVANTLKVITPGIYMINGQVNWGSGANAATSAMNITINNALVPGQATSTGRVNASALVRVVAGDLITLHVYSTTASSIVAKQFRAGDFVLSAVRLSA